MNLQLLGFRDPEFCTKVLNQFTLQPVQRHIGQRRGNDASLRRTGRRRLQLTLVNQASLQPLPENRRVHRDIAFQPVMVDVIKASLFYIRFQYPSG